MPDIQVRRLTSADKDAIATVLSDDDGYSLRINGHPADAREVSDLLTVRPPSATPEQKHTFGLFVDGRLVGVADLLDGWPEPGMVYLGLLQIKGDQHRKGLGRLFHERLLQLFPHADCWRLTVVETNDQVVPFWERLGYRPTGEMKTWRNSSGQNLQAVVLEHATPGD